MRPSETCSIYYGPHVRLLLLPTPPRSDAVTVGYRPECVYLEGTRTPLAVCARRRTKSGVSPLDAYVRLRAFVEHQRCPESTLKCELQQTLARSGIPSEFML